MIDLVNIMKPQAVTGIANSLRASAMSIICVPRVRAGVNNNVIRNRAEHVPSDTLAFDLFLPACVPFSMTATHFYRY